MKMMGTLPTPPETLTRARGIALKNGVRYAYTGNVHDSHGGSTLCPQCGELLIERDWYELGHWGLDGHGRCEKCNYEIAGLFEQLPGDWGARRQGVRMST